jgi:hypothetical protein
MSKAAHLPAALIPSAVSPEIATSPLDPTLLFAGIGLLALVVAIVFGQPGVWF